MQTYRVEVQPPALRDLDRLAPTLFERITSRMRDLADAPRGAGVTRLHGGHGYRVRVGDHRILFDIDDRQKVVTIFRVRHRREVYRRMR